MHRSQRIRLLTAAAVALVGLAALGAAVPAQSLLPSDRTLVVEDAETGEHLIEAPVENGTVVVLNYTHSVEKTRVLDVYEVRGDELVMVRMEFESYGWGLPSRANVTKEDGMYVFDPEWRGEELSVKPGRVAGHTLEVGDRTYDLVSRSDARSVRIHVVSRSPLDRILEI